MNLFFRSIDYPLTGNHCFLSHKKCGDPDVSCGPDNYTYCHLSAVCHVPYLHYADEDSTSAFACDNVTVTCHEGFQSLDGKQEFVLQCLISGSWNLSFVDCVSDNLVPFMGPLHSRTHELFDQRFKTCIYFSDRISVYIDGIRATTIEIFGPGLNCKPSAGHISVITALTTVESCSLQKENHLNESLGTSCQYQCTPGYGILVHFRNTTICEIENN